MAEGRSLMKIFLLGWPQADGNRLVMVSRIAVCVWAVIMGAIMCIAQVLHASVATSAAS